MHAGKKQENDWSVDLCAIHCPTQVYPKETARDKAELNRGLYDLYNEASWFINIIELRRIAAEQRC